MAAKKGSDAVAERRHRFREALIKQFEEQKRMLQAALDKAAEIYADLRAAGQLIEDADILITAIALVNDLTLVTNNTAHFSRIVGLQLEDWLIP